MDKISLKTAFDCRAWMMVWAGESERKIEVEMTYEDLRNIPELMDRDKPVEPETTLFCPVCGAGRIIDPEYSDVHNFCHNCGQRFDWGDDE